MRSIVTMMLVLFQEDDPSVIFGRIEKAFLSASSLKITFTFHVGTGYQMVGSIVARGENEMVLESSFEKNAGRGPRLHLVSDGKTMTWFSSEYKPEGLTSEAAPRMNEWFKKGFMLVGISRMCFLWSLFPLGRDFTGVKLDEDWRITNFKTITGKERLKGVGYSVLAEDRTKVVDVDLYYDPSTYALVHCTIRGEGESSRIAEENMNVDLNYIIPEGTFTVPSAARLVAKESSPFLAQPHSGLSRIELPVDYADPKEWISWSTEIWSRGQRTSEPQWDKQGIRKIRQIQTMILEVKEGDGAMGESCSVKGTLSSSCYFGSATKTSREFSKEIPSLPFSVAVRLSPSEGPTILEANERCVWAILKHHEKLDISEATSFEDLVAKADWALLFRLKAIP